MDKTNLLSRDSIQLILHGGFAAFAVYFCMYAFRKPFAVAEFEGMMLFGISYKIVLVISQVIGYASSKFIGIKFISELRPQNRAWYIILCIGLAELALLGFALVPAPYNFFFLFLNGLPLGMIWGLVFSFLEGRRVTEVLAAILSSSFIISSGMVKSMGSYLMLNFGLSEFWMPFATGLIFLLPLLFFTWMLQRLPAPTDEDEDSRVRREPMSAADRRKVFRSMAGGLIALILVYMMVTAFRDFRDNFAVEIWSEVGYAGDSTIFTRSEIPVSVTILIMLGLFFLIRNNERAFRWMNIAILGGLALLGLSNLAFAMGWISSPLTWMILTGIGLYIAYVPYGSMLFDRLIALFRFKGNAGYFIYLADAFGYLGSILVLLYKEFFQQSISLFEFFLAGGYVLSIVGAILMLYSVYYFKRLKVAVE